MLEIVNVMSRTPKACCCEPGYTLNEVLVAMNIVVVGILGYSLSTVGVMRGNSSSSHYAVAINLAQDKMEQLKGNKGLTNTNNCPESGEREITAMAGPGGIYNRCWAISESALGTKLKQITVTVSWHGPEHQEVTLTTLAFLG